RSLAADVPGGLDVVRQICQRCGVDPDQRLATMPWTERKLVDAEIAALEGGIAVVTDWGLDPLGQQRFARHLKVLAQRPGVAVLVLRGLVGFSTGAWSDRQVEIVLAR